MSARKRPNTGIPQVSAPSSHPSLACCVLTCPPLQSHTRRPWCWGSKGPCRRTQGQHHSHRPRVRSETRGESAISWIETLATTHSGVPCDLSRSVGYAGVPDAVAAEVRALISNRLQRLCVRWRLRLHIQGPQVLLPRPPVPARRRVLLVLCCFQRLELPPELALCVLQMLTLAELSL